MKVQVPESFKAPWSYVKIGDIFNVESVDKHGFFSTEDGMIFGRLKNCRHLNGDDWIILSNRYQLRQFITKNKIDMKATSLMLGKSRSWLATMCYESKRGDIKQSSLDRIIAALSIDWNSKTPVMVNSKGYVPYKTIPANYIRTQDKARLMKAYLNGEVK